MPCCLFGAAVRSLSVAEGSSPIQFCLPCSLSSYPSISLTLPLGIRQQLSIKETIVARPAILLLRDRQTAVQSTVFNLPAWRHLPDKSKCLFAHCTTSSCCHMSCQTDLSDNDLHQRGRVALLNPVKLVLRQHQQVSRAYCSLCKFCLLLLMQVMEDGIGACRPAA